MNDRFIVRALGKRFTTSEGRFDALADISLRVAPGEFVACVGASGCGKIDLAEDHRRLGAIEQRRGIGRRAPHSRT
jgi:ABC-type glutathione transport system ATPase component